ncbi:hypothetical protein NQ314_000280 [Rhamnusium bicolor]|uniref:Uncharacterized protein n=1 Tax=Rhamnusium bicolor TaxID=1586634 RepID=A0AAV8ZVM4_9CUCU|nr:hypothetical protein NQ314_000280 [Rhamnusium bicolor]
MSKYEELLANQNGLLKVLEMRISDIRKYQEENTNLKQEIETLKMSMETYEGEISKLSNKNKELKMKKE